MLGTDVVIEGDFGESRGKLGIGRGTGFAVPEEGRDDDEILKGV